MAYWENSKGNTTEGISLGEANVLSKIPQGTVLDLLDASNIYINDIDDNIHSSIHLFVNDYAFTG